MTQYLVKADGDDWDDAYEVDADSPSDAARAAAEYICVNSSEYEWIESGSEMQVKDPSGKVTNLNVCVEYTTYFHASEIE